MLFTPDILPIDVDEDDGTLTGSLEEQEVTILNSKRLSATIYESMGLSAETTVDVGDLLFYTGEFADQALGSSIW